MGPGGPKWPPRGAQDSPREVRRGPGAQDGPGTFLEGPGAARERPKGPGGAQEGPERLPECENLVYVVFAPPISKSDGLASNFKRKLQPNRGFRGVDAPTPRNLRGFSHRGSTKPTPRGPQEAPRDRRDKTRVDKTRGDERRQDMRRQGKRRQDHRTPDKRR